MAGVADYQARLLEDLSLHRLLGGLAGLYAAARQRPPLTAAGSSASLVHHQDSPVTHDHGGGPFSFAHESQANRMKALLLKGCG
ncbi:hypothetical protein Ato02nite_089860 [Paractinoplanes toevensis]|uniref:Uncharacterized protein n=1 Tax=Paractinoplanes toevensis TaxID=571911 RepID=A0A919WBS8_9ACTN|nr:hypothetical protein Ato02nite_089860 [Actinoplanes toevensis]